MLSRFSRLNSWQQGGVRAPHKPLLALLALGELSRGNRRLLFKDFEKKLEALLREFGPTRASYHPEYPFWRLQNDDIWIVESERDVRRRESNAGDVPATELRSAGSCGSFSSDVLSELELQPSQIPAVAELLLAAHFPETVHQDILDAVGLVSDFSMNIRRRRDPKFRDQVLLAYYYQCAVCGLDVRMGSITIGLEAAHIKWHQARGPDSVNNGIALCSLHHKLFDLGAFTVDPDLRLLVSDKVHGTARLDDVLLQHHGQVIFKTANPDHRPLTTHLNWHRNQVFKEGVRFFKADPFC